MRVRRFIAALASVLVAIGVTAGCTPDGDAPPAPVITNSGPVRVTLAVYGADPVISAYTTIAARFQADNPGITVNIRPFATHDAAMAYLARTKGTDEAPDVYLAGRTDLDRLMRNDANQRVDKMLSERNVDFGDSYVRQSLEAFSADSALQCMPVSISPLVVYYNRALVDLSTLRPGGGRQPSPDEGWRFDDFVAAADQAAAVTGRKGVYVAPDVAQVAPFVYSGGDSLVDDPDDPTELTLSDGADVWEPLLDLLRDPRLAFTEAQLEKQSALSRFKTGQLGMILGYRSLTPELRKQEGLTFGVMPMPRVGRSATVNDVEGFCVKPDLPHRTSTAALLAYLVSDDAAEVLAKTGYVVPANVNVLNSEAFTQPDQQPFGAQIFGDQVRYGIALPHGLRWEQSTRALDAAFGRLIYGRSTLTVPEQLAEVDQTISPLLAPGPSPSGTPSSSPSGSPSGSSSPSPSD